MPCRSYEEEYEDLSGRSAARLGVLREKCDDLTRLLCFACEFIEFDSVEMDADTEELYDWLNVHRKKDRQNLQKMFTDNLESLSKEDFDTIDAILSEYN